MRNKLVEPPLPRLTEPYRVWVKGLQVIFYTLLLKPAKYLKINPTIFSISTSTVFLINLKLRLVLPPTPIYTTVCFILITIRYLITVLRNFCQESSQYFQLLLIICQLCSTEFDRLSIFLRYDFAFILSIVGFSTRYSFFSSFVLTNLTIGYCVFSFLNLPFYLLHFMFFLEMIQFAGFVEPGKGLGRGITICVFHFDPNIL